MAVVGREDRTTPVRCSRDGAERVPSPRLAEALAAGRPYPAVIRGSSSRVR